MSLGLKFYSCEQGYHFTSTWSPTWGCYQFKATFNANPMLCFHLWVFSFNVCHRYFAPVTKILFKKPNETACLLLLYATFQTVSAPQTHTHTQSQTNCAWHACLWYFLAKTYNVSACICMTSVSNTAPWDLVQITTNHKSLGVFVCLYCHSKMLEHFTGTPYYS
jgi:hypothetical protein